MVWLERGGYALALLVIGAFIFAFTYKVDETITADKVKITGETTTVKAPFAMKSIKPVVASGTEVKKGDRLYVDNYPEATDVLAPADGIFYDKLPEGQTSCPADFELGTVTNYDSLIIEASLSGQSVSQAKSGLPVKISNVVAEPIAGIRLTGQVNGDNFTSGFFFNEEDLGAINDTVKGKWVKARDDFPLQIKEVSEILLDAKVVASPANDANALPQEPLSKQTFTGTVESGSHSGSFQWAILPTEVKDKIISLLKAKSDQVAVNVGSQGKFFLKDFESFNPILKIKVEEGEGTASDLNSVASVSRSFDAKIVLENPPAELIALVKQSDQFGKPVTCKVEVKTGSKPIAFVLLKKS